MGVDDEGAPIPRYHRVPYVIYLFLLTRSITVPLFKVFLNIRFVTRNGWVWGWGGVGDVNVPCTCLHV